MSIYCPPLLHFENLQLLNFDFDTDPDPKPVFDKDADLDSAFHSDVNPDPVSHNCADPEQDPKHCLSYYSIKVPLACLRFLTFIQIPLRDSLRRNVSKFIEAWIKTEKSEK